MFRELFNNFFKKYSNKIETFLVYGIPICLIIIGLYQEDENIIPKVLLSFIVLFFSYLILHIIFTTNFIKRNEKQK